MAIYEPHFEDILDVLDRETRELIDGVESVRGYDPEAEAELIRQIRSKVATYPWPTTVCQAAEELVLDYEDEHYR